MNLQYIPSERSVGQVVSDIAKPGEVDDVLEYLSKREEEEEFKEKLKRFLQKKKSVQKRRKEEVKKKIILQEYPFEDIKSGMDDAIRKINQVLAKKPLNKDIEFITHLSSFILTQIINIFRIDIYYNLTSDKIEFFDNDKEIEFENIIPKEEEVCMVNITMYTDANATTMFKHYSHANALIMYTKNKVTSCCFIEPHGVFMDSEIEIKEQILDKNHPWVKKYFNVKDDIDELKKFRQELEHEDDNDSEILNLKLLNLFLRKTEVEYEFNRMITKKILVQNDVEFFRPNYNIQYKDEIGFCFMVYYILEMVNDLINKTNADSYTSESFIKNILFVLEQLVKWDIPKTQNSYSFQKGGIMGYFNFVYNILYRKDFPMYEETYIEANEKQKMFVYDENFVPDISQLKTPELVEAAQFFMTKFHFYVQNAYLRSEAEAREKEIREYEEDVEFVPGPDEESEEEDLYEEDFDQPKRKRKSSTTRRVKRRI